MSEWMFYDCTEKVSVEQICGIAIRIPHIPIAFGSQTVSLN